MTNIIAADYNGTQVFFQDDAFLNATAIAGHFNKKPIEWLRLPSTEEYINALCQKEEVGKSHFIKTTKGKGKNGTWLHRRLAVAFARWLNVDFAIWCDEQIEKILISKNQPKQLALPETITPEEQRQIQNVVTVAHHRTGLSYAEIYSQLKNQFKIAKYDQLPRSELNTAIDFINHIQADKPAPIGKIDWLNLYSLVTFLHKWAMFTQDLPHIYHYLKQHKESEALAEIINNHFSNIRENTRLFDNSILALGEIAQHSPLPPEQRGILLNLLQELIEPKRSTQINPIFAHNPF